ncbi:Mitochondrial outer membrane protein porin of 36 kDa [Spatholobus suberectus]|nr:Mitochondrial outer membrane protein porin of 36 kDa [Spatholobus suberectus]
MTLPRPQRVRPLLFHHPHFPFPHTVFPSSLSLPFSPDLHHEARSPPTKPHPNSAPNLHPVLPDLQGDAAVQLHNLRPCTGQQRVLLVRSRTAATAVQIRSAIDLPSIHMFLPSRSAINIFRAGSSGFLCKHRSYTVSSTSRFSNACFLQERFLCLRTLVSTLILAREFEEITSIGVRKGKIYLADVSAKLEIKNITTDVKVDTNPNVHPTL